MASAKEILQKFAMLYDFNSIKVGDTYSSNSTYAAFIDLIGQSNFKKISAATAAFMTAFPTPDAPKIPPADRKLGSNGTGLGVSNYAQLIRLDLALDVPTLVAEIGPYGQFAGVIIRPFVTAGRHIVNGKWDPAGWTYEFKIRILGASGFACGSGQHSVSSLIPVQGDTGIISTMDFIFAISGSDQGGEQKVSSKFYRHYCGQYIEIQPEIGTATKWLANTLPFIKNFATGACTVLKAIGNTPIEGIANSYNGAVVPVSGAVPVVTSSSPDVGVWTNSFFGSATSGIRNFFNPKNSANSIYEFGVASAGLGVTFDLGSLKNHQRILVGVLPFLGAGTGAALAGYLGSYAGVPAAAAISGAQYGAWAMMAAIATNQDLKGGSIYMTGVAPWAAIVRQVKDIPIVGQQTFSIGLRVQFNYFLYWNLWKSSSP